LHETAQKANWGKQMSESTVWRKENAVSTSATPSMATYSDAMNKFTKAATAFMDHVHLLNEARDAYQVAITTSASLRNNLDAGDRALRSLMTQMEQVVNAHLGEASLDRKKPEALKVEAIRTNAESTVPGGKFLP
jgi:hypothetical protein